MKFVGKRIYKNHPFILLMLTSGFLAVFVVFLRKVVYNSDPLPSDFILYNSVAYLWNPWLDRFMLLITRLGNPIPVALYSSVLFLSLSMKREWALSSLFSGTIVGGFFLEEVFKLIIQRPRPESIFLEMPGYSFPSGHATIAIVFLGLLLYIWGVRVKPGIRKTLFTGISIMVFVLVGLSRIYLHVHWASDVVAGFFLGLFWVMFSIFIFEEIKKG